MGTGHARECQALVIIGVRGSMMLASAVCIVLQSDFAVNKAKLPSTPWLVESRAIFSAISRKIVLTARPCSASLMLVLFNVMAVKGREAFHLADPVCHYNAECMKQWQVPGCPCNQEMCGEAMPRCIAACTKRNGTHQGKFVVASGVLPYFWKCACASPRCSWWCQTLFKIVSKTLGQRFWVYGVRAMITA